MVENNSFENKYSIEEAYNEMVRRNLGDSGVCPVCHSSLPSKLFVF